MPTHTYTKDLIFILHTFVIISISMYSHLSSVQSLVAGVCIDEEAVRMGRQKKAMGTWPDSLIL